MTFWSNNMDSLLVKIRIWDVGSILEALSNPTFLSPRVLGPLSPRAEWRLQLFRAGPQCPDHIFLRVKPSVLKVDLLGLWLPGQRLSLVLQGSTLTTPVASD